MLSAFTALVSKLLNYQITRLPNLVRDSCLFAKFAANYFDLRSSAEICGEEVWLNADG